MKIVAPAQPILKGKPHGLEALSHSLEHLEKYGNRSHFAVAVSGGADSLALTLLMKEWCSQKGLKISTLTVDHGLRDASFQEAQQVGIWMEDRDIPHTILQWHPTSDSVPHEKSREARYDLLLNWCMDNSVDYLLTAHHQDDLAETIMMRFMNGSGIDGLSGIAPKVQARKVIILRPLLSYSKASLKAYLESQNQSWIEDPSNESENYQRSRVRKFMSEEGLTSERLISLSKKMTQTRDYFEQTISEWLKNHAQFNPAGFYLINPLAFKSTHPELQTRILVRVLNIIGGNIYPPRLDALQSLLQRLKESPSTQTLHGCLISHWQKHLLISREESLIQEKTSINPKTFNHWDNRFEIRCKEKGYSIGKLGLQNWTQIRKKVNKQIAEILPAAVKPTLPSIYKENQLISSPYLEYNPENLPANTDFLVKSKLFNPIFTIA